MGRAPGDRGRLSHSHLKTFSVAANEYAGNGKREGRVPTVVTWDKLVQVCGQYPGVALRSRARHFAFWRLVTKGIVPAVAEARARLSGDLELARLMLTTAAIIA
jgi:hypothetical protein